MPRYHVETAGCRTTVTLDKILSSLLALHLGHWPGDDGAHAAVVRWLQGKIDADLPFASIDGLSQWLQGQAVLAVARQELLSKLIVESPAVVGATGREIGAAMTVATD